MKRKYILKSRKKAFTLIELLVVIAIIGILFIVLTSKVDFALDKAKATGVQSLFRSYQMAFEQVSKETGGFNMFGYNTGDKSDDSLWSGKTTPDGQAYTYTNKDNDAGDRIRNAYDVGDANLNGKMEEGEIWTGRKLHTETWTSVWTLTHPTKPNDVSAYQTLEDNINYYLDHSLRITINPPDNNGVVTITMANSARDPWFNEFKGYYITNAIEDNGMDRGAIVLYSAGPNGAFGSKHEIKNGIVTITVPGNNILGKDDYALVTLSTQVNGHVATKTITQGFSQNQTFFGQPMNGSDDMTPTPDPTPNPDPIPTPDPQPEAPTTLVPVKPDLNSYTWADIKTLAQANLSETELRDVYHINVGDSKVVNGYAYILVDLDGNDYDGFVFMYNSNVIVYDAHDTEEASGGYFESHLFTAVNALYDDLKNTDNDLYQVIKPVTVKSNNVNGQHTNIRSEVCHLFLASHREIGGVLFADNNPYEEEPDGSLKLSLDYEGRLFDYFTSDARRASFTESEKWWWLRSCNPNSRNAYLGVRPEGNLGAGMFSAVISFTDTWYYPYLVPAFVIG